LLQKKVWAQCPKTYLKIPLYKKKFYAPRIPPNDGGLPVKKIKLNTQNSNLTQKKMNFKKMYKILSKHNERNEKLLKRKNSRHKSISNQAHPGY
jgi:hypothetical protein